MAGSDTTTNKFYRISSKALPAIHNTDELDCTVKKHHREI